MPTITGDLKLVTQIPAGATHLHIHAPQTRVTGSTVILTDPDIIQVKPDGTFTTTIEPGEAICIPAYSGTMGLPIPILVKPQPLPKPYGTPGISPPTNVIPSSTCTTK